MKRLAALALLVAGCYSATVMDQQYSCPDGKTCPNGLQCNTCRLCVHPLADGTLPANGCPGCAQHDLMVNGKPSPNGFSFGAPDVEFCYSAWQVPGIDAAATCNHSPRTDGMGCAAADNCALGWHLCRDDKDLAGRGVNNNQCVATEDGSTPMFWATQQIASYAASMAGNPTGAVSCNSTGIDAPLIGCGKLGQRIAGAGCTVEQSYLGLPRGITRSCVKDTTVVPPKDTSWCRDTTGATAQAEVIKTGLDHGGVICCRDP